MSDPEANRPVRRAAKSLALSSRPLSEALAVQQDAVVDDLSECKRDDYGWKLSG
jgi:hypothetical protein